MNGFAGNLGIKPDTRGWPTPTGWVPKAQETLTWAFQCKGRVLLPGDVQGAASCSLGSPAPRRVWVGPRVRSRQELSDGVRNSQAQLRGPRGAVASRRAQCQEECHQHIDIQQRPHHIPSSRQSCWTAAMVALGPLRSGNTSKPLRRSSSATETSAAAALNPRARRSSSDTT